MPLLQVVELPYDGKETLLALDVNHGKRIQYALSPDEMERLALVMLEKVKEIRKRK